MGKAILIHEADQVITVSERVKKGESIWYLCADERITFQAVEDIPQFHKAARQPIAQKEKICKYGEIIGEALSFIPTGALVHTQNMCSMGLTTDKNIDRKERKQQA